MNPEKDFGDLGNYPILHALSQTTEISDRRILSLYDTEEDRLTILQLDEFLKSPRKDIFNRIINYASVMQMSMEYATSESNLIHTHLKRLDVADLSLVMDIDSYHRKVFDNYDKEAFLNMCDQIDSYLQGDGDGN